MDQSRDATLLQDKAAAIAADARSLLAKIQDTPTVHETPSFRLAHYTTLEALVSMLQCSSGGLRLSDSSTMNDPEEGCATRDGRSIRHLLKDEFEEDSWPRRRYDAAHICCFVGVERGAEDVNPGDDLLFWRLYGGDCRGLSITLAPHVSADLLSTAHVQEVTYKKEPPRRLDLRPISSLLQKLEELRSRANDAQLWPSVCPRVLPDCDRLMAYRFLHKRAHYAMEREYRVVAFATDDAYEDRLFAATGHHVQYGRIRRYVQIPELACKKILGTKSFITIGSNVPETDHVETTVATLVEKSLRLAPNVVSVGISRTQYRAR